MGVGKAHKVKAMQLVDLQSDLTYIYYDDIEQCYKQKFGTLKEFLQIFADFNSLYIYTLNFGKITNENEQKRIQ